MSSEMKIEMPCFVMVSYDDVIVTQRIEELMTAISQRQFFCCEVAVLNEVEEATRYAVQKYYANFYANPFLAEETAMPLPIPASNQFYNIKSNRLATAICENDKNLELTPSGVSSKF